MTDDDRQPWHPEGLPLPQVGMRVRIHVSAECRWPHDRYDPDGAWGWVIDNRLVRTPGNDNDRHPYGVRFPGQKLGRATYYALSELEALGPPPLDGRASDARGESD